MGLLDDTFSAYNHRESFLINGFRGCILDWNHFFRRRATSPSAHPTEFNPRIESFGRIHCAMDFDLANLAMVQVDDGYVAIDAGSAPKISLPIVEQWGKLAGGPVRGMIYTHSHIDHIGGSEAFNLNNVPIWAHANFSDELGLSQLLPNAYFVRGAKQFGYALPPEEVVSNGVGPPMRLNETGRTSIRFPNELVRDSEETTIGGQTFILQSAPGETGDHLMIWLPDQKVLFAGDNIFEAFPNLYSIRGVPPRPVRQWIDTLDRMRRLQPRPELMILGHTAPVQGADKIYQVLTDYRDAIAFVHDSVVRGINAGKTPDQLCQEIKLPKHLVNHPYLKEKYGTVHGSVRGIYSGYMGWFDGDGTNLVPLSDHEIAGWVMEDMGGRDKVNARFDQAIAEGDLRRALWLARVRFANNPKASDSRQAKAVVLEQMAEKCENPINQNWLASEAALLRNRCRLPNKPKISGDLLENIPIEQLLGLLPSRLNPKTSANSNFSLGFDITDRKQQFTLLVRYGIGELAPGLIESPQLIVRATERNLKRVFLAGDTPPTQRGFWQSLEFEVPDCGLLTPFKRLLRLAQVSRLFLRA